VAVHAGLRILPDEIGHDGYVVGYEKNLWSDAHLQLKE